MIFVSHLPLFNTSQFNKIYPKVNTFPKTYYFRAREEIYISVNVNLLQKGCNNLQKGRSFDLQLQ